MTTKYISISKTGSTDMSRYDPENIPIESGSVKSVPISAMNIIIATGITIMIASISIAMNLWTMSACSILCPICWGG